MGVVYVVGEYLGQEICDSRRLKVPFEPTYHSSESSGLRSFVTANGG